MRTQNLSFKKYFSSLSGFLKRKFKSLLFLFFILSVASWAWIFWQHVYAVVFSEPEVKEAKFIKIKKAEAEAIAEDLDKREKLLEQIKNRSFTDPFTEKHIPSDLITPQNNTTSTEPIIP